MERRARRSDEPQQALVYQLQQSAERSGLQAVVVADGEGFLVASSPWADDQSEELAAMLPSFFRGEQIGEVLPHRAPSYGEVSVSVFEAAGLSLLIGAVGAVHDADVRQEMDHAAAGVQRIIG